MVSNSLLIKQYRKNFEFLIGLKNFIGNIDNRIHDSAMVLVEDFLKVTHPEIEDWDFKMGSQNGLDIEGSIDGIHRVIGELKTTKPYGTTDFGAQQKATILNDLERLESNDIEYKYFFVIDSNSLDILLKKYHDKFPTVNMVNILNIENENLNTQGENKNKDKTNIEDVVPIMNNEFDIEIKLTEGPINGYFFNIPKKYQHLIQEGNIEIINDLGDKMYCNTPKSMGKSRISKDLNDWYNMKKFQPNDMFYLKKLEDRKFKVVSIKRANA